MLEMVTTSKRGNFMVIGQFSLVGILIDLKATTVVSAWDWTHFAWF
jgi:hypothetical protein